MVPERAGRALASQPRKGVSSRKAVKLTYGGGPNVYQKVRLK